ncbi:DJ-1/PfpI/YhbO family deglycase/protease [Acinetobacter stercoris]|uniref:General stress protein 18 n=1 Tax=Acinetobacter stercoris TaxID=2126983 RepID=A0A2U3N1D5_9GAMM|nr:MULTISPECIES: DJ-1/PfpI/YhbO family deglycase/protease [Acinetobacter]SPL71369.1 General stress protein 18 [Acinetobacter stercoris]
MKKRVAVLVTHEFEDAEYSEPVEAFRATRNSVTNIENKAGNIVYGKNRKISVSIDKGIDEVNVHEFDALLLPGGESPSRLYIDDRFVLFVRKFANTQKPIFMCPSSPILLIHAGVIKGRRITHMQSIYKDLEDAGAVLYDQEVINDNNMYISSRSTQDLPFFIQETIKVLNR